MRIALGTLPLTGPTLDGKLLFKAFGSVWIGLLCWSVEDWARRTGRTPEEQHFEPATWRMYQRGKSQSAGDYLLAVQDLQHISRDVARLAAQLEQARPWSERRPPAGA